MPSRYVHKQFSKMLVEKDCDKTHEIIDYPVRFLKSNHRILFHDPLSAMVIGLLVDGKKGSYAGLSHIILDCCCSQIPEFKYLPKAIFYLKKIM